MNETKHNFVTFYKVFIGGSIETVFFSLLFHNWARNEEKETDKKSNAQNRVKFMKEKKVSMEFRSLLLPAMFVRGFWSFILFNFRANISPWNFEREIKIITGV